MTTSKRWRWPAWAMVCVVLIGGWADRTEAAGGLHVGLVVAKEGGTISVRDQAGTTRTFAAPKKDDQPDPTITRQIETTPIGSKVIVKWGDGEPPAILILKVLVRGEGKLPQAPDNGNNGDAASSPQAGKKHGAAIAWKRFAGREMRNYNPGRDSGYLMGTLIDTDLREHRWQFTIWPDGKDRPVFININRVRPNKQWEPDPRILKQVKAIPRHSRVKVDYKYDNGLYAKDVRKISAPAASGLVIGKVVAKNEDYRGNWLAVCALKDENVYQYGTTKPGKGQSVDVKKFNDSLQALELGTTIKAKWYFDGMCHISEFEVLEEPDANEPLKRLGAEEMERRRKMLISEITSRMEEYQERLDKWKSELERLGPLE